MLLILLLLFMLTALGGVLFAALEARGRALPLRLTVSHGALGALLIVLLVMRDVAQPENHPANAAALVFILAATGGLLLFAFRASRQRLPLPVVGLHAAFAVAGLALLGIACLRS